MNHVLSRIFLLFSLFVTMVGVAWGEVSQDETRIQSVQEQVNQDFAATRQGRHGEILAKQFDVSQDDIQKIRANGKGWGEITIQLAVADRLFKNDQQLAEPRFANYSEAVQEVTRLRQEGKGWGKISQELGFKLGPVVRDAQHTRNEIRRELRLADKQVQKGRVEKGHSGNREKGAERRLSRPQKPERIAKPERPQRPERAARANRPDRPSRPNRPGK